jgi:nucleoid DNA-binding protein
MLAKTDADTQLTVFESFASENQLPIFFNPQTVEALMLDAKRMVSFRCSRVLKKKVIGAG